MMGNLLVSLAQTMPGDNLPGTWSSFGTSMKDVVKLLGAVCLLTLVLVLWVVYARKRHRHHHRHSHHHHAPAPGADPVSGSDDNGHSRRRRRRRHHRPRNPTLAETGGLPPIKQENPPEQIP